MRGITPSAHASGQAANISQRLLGGDLALTAKSPPPPGHALQPRRAGRVDLGQATSCILRPHSQPPKERPSSHTLKRRGTQAMPSRPPATPSKKGGLNLRLPLSGCVPLGKSLSLSGLQISLLENGPSGANLLQLDAVTQDSSMLDELQLGTELSGTVLALVFRNSAFPKR